MEQHQEYWGMQLKPYCMLIHISQLASIVAPGLGFILPVVLWVAHKDKHPDIDKHGRVTINWIISCLIYSIIFGILTLIVIGAFGLILLAIVNFLFAIIAAIKANHGELWPYPLSITFLRY